MKLLYYLAAFFLLLVVDAFTQGNNYVQNYRKFEGLALTPPMGWNSWNKFACNVDENLIRQMADAMVASGMKAAGPTTGLHSYQIPDVFGNPSATVEAFPKPPEALSNPSRIHLESNSNTPE